MLSLACHAAPHTVSGGPRGLGRNLACAAVPPFPNRLSADLLVLHTRGHRRPRSGDADGLVRGSPCLCFITPRCTSPPRLLASSLLAPCRSASQGGSEWRERTTARMLLSTPNFPLPDTQPFWKLNPLSIHMEASVLTSHLSPGLNSLSSFHRLHEASAPSARRPRGCCGRDRLTCVGSGVTF